MAEIDRISAVSALDVMRDTHHGGRIFRERNVMDEAGRGALRIDVALSIPAIRVIRFLKQLVERRGRP